ncbi:MAG: aminopeptidase, partial [Bdellovibrionales bacterium]|nr:aminopeptidase [Bdellovibrionales bacterium]
MSLGCSKVRIQNLILISVLPFLSGCLVPYLVKSGYHQAQILASRVPIEKALQDPNLTAEEKQKLELVAEAKEFAKSELKLNVSGQYSSYVKLDRPYVTYVVSAAPPFELEHHYFSYPLVGKLPYKGFFNPDEA